MRRMRSAYLVIANTAVLMLVIEFISHLGILGYRAQKPQLRFESLPPVVQRNYAHMPPADVTELWTETLALRWRYEPIVGFVPATMASRFVNVNEYGVRSNGGQQHAVDRAVWFFGGSTTFGYGVTDDETIPAAVEKLIGQPVINFGVPAHYSHHENRWLSHHLRLGFRPTIALFLDGINESCEADLAEDELGQLVELSQRGYSWQPARPVVYLARQMLTKTARSAGLLTDELTFPLESTCRSAGRSFSLREAHARALRERQAICDLYQIECRTYIQPFAGVHGRHDRPEEDDAPSLEYFRRLFHYLEPVWQEGGVTLVTGALDGLDHHAYVDEAHYSAESHRLIAAAIAATLPGEATTSGASGRRP